MWSRPIPSPWHMYKQDLMKLNLQTVSFAADAMRMLNRARLPVNGLYSGVGSNNRRGLVDNRWHKLQLYNHLEICRIRGTALKQYNGSS